MISNHESPARPEPQRIQGCHAPHVVHGGLSMRLNEEVFMATPVTVPMVGKIVSVTVKVGDKVKEDDQVAVLEAMKMEMPLVAPVSGVIKEVCVSAGQEVEAEATIAVIE
jgi:biotin carboxyl carrier protein